jgi:hypothetical protein
MTKDTLNMGVKQREHFVGGPRRGVLGKRDMRLVSGLNWLSIVVDEGQDMSCAEPSHPIITMPFI